MFAGEIRDQLVRVGLVEPRAGITSTREQRAQGRAMARVFSLHAADRQEVDAAADGAELTPRFLEARGHIAVDGLEPGLLHERHEVDLVTRRHTLQQVIGT
jgi:hypothetical protein